MCFLSPFVLRDLLKTLTDDELTTLQKSLCSTNDNNKSDFNLQKRNYNGAGRKCRSCRQRQKSGDVKQQQVAANNQNNKDLSLNNSNKQTDVNDLTTIESSAALSDVSVNSDDSSSSNSSFNEEETRDEVCVRITVASKHRRTNSTPDVEIVYSELATPDDDSPA